MEEEEEQEQGQEHYDLRTESSVVRHEADALVARQTEKSIGYIITRLNEAHPTARLALGLPLATMKADLREHLTTCPHHLHDCIEWDRQFDAAQFQPAPAARARAARQATAKADKAAGVDAACAGLYASRGAMRALLKELYPDKERYPAAWRRQNPTRMDLNLLVACVKAALAGRPEAEQRDLVARACATAKANAKAAAVAAAAAAQRPPAAPPKASTSAASTPAAPPTATAPPSGGAALLTLHAMARALVAALEGDRADLQLIRLLGSQVGTYAERAWREGA